MKVTYSLHVGSLRTPMTNEEALADQQFYIDVVLLTCTSEFLINETAYETFNPFL